jgi:acetylornithine deacetylase/succinyl-diaminopimelate desuccinylase-like protein
MTSPFEYAAQHGHRFVDELKDLLRIPSISALSEHKGDVQKAAEWLRDHCLSLGMTRAEVFPTAGHPVVYAEWLGAGDAPTVLVYGHYDVQPVDDPRKEWRTPPFDPTEREGHLYARGATDDKGQTFIHLKAFESFMQTEGKFPLNLKVMLEGEEEVSSTNLKGFMETHTDLLKCDLVVISDTDVLAPDIPSITYGLRGLIYTEIEVFGPSTDLHSGQFGGAVHNPAQALVEILAQLHDSAGRVTVPGFYDEVVVLIAEERQALAQLPVTEAEFKQQAGVERLWGEPEFTFLERVGARPTLEINGIVGGWTGEGAKTVIGARALAKVSCRLAARQNPQKIFQALQEHVAHLTPPTVRSEVRAITDMSPAVLVPIDSQPMQIAAQAYEKTFGKAPVFARSGGSIPVVVLCQEVLNQVPVLLLGFGLPDDNLHAPNEKFTLSMFHKGIQTMLHFYSSL